MAKEQGDNSELSVKMKFALWVIGIVFAAGMTYTTVTANSKKIEINTGDIKNNTKQISTVQRGQDRIGHDIQTIKEDLSDEKKARVLKRQEDRDFQKEQRAINSKILTELTRWEAIENGKDQAKAKR